VSTDPPHTQPHTRSSLPTAIHHDISTVLARDPCAGCGAPLGADQRYCLSCGIPRAGTRLPFLDVLHTEASSAGVIESGSQPAALLRMPALATGAGGSGVGRSLGGWWDGENGLAVKLRDNSGLFALLGVLLLALLIGLLLGHWVSEGSRTVAATPSKQVIEVKGLATAAGAPAPSVAGSPTSSASSEPSSASAAGAVPPASHAPKVSNPTVSKLAQTTGKEHAKEVEKALSKGGGTLSTGAASPPKATSKSEASKPIGGGSEVASIE
jgi:hypothetical protein